MTAPVRLVLPWPPTTGNKQYEGYGRRRHLREDVQGYRSDVFAIWLNHGRPQFTEPVHISWHLTPPTHRDYDFDNLRKIVMDALQPPVPTKRIDRARVLRNDSNKCVPREAVNWYSVDRKIARVVLEIRSLEES